MRTSGDVLPFQTVNVWKISFISFTKKHEKHHIYFPIKLGGWPNKHGRESMFPKILPMVVSVKGTPISLSQQLDIA